MGFRVCSLRKRGFGLSVTKELIQYLHQHILDLDIHDELDDFIDHGRLTKKRNDKGFSL